MQLAQYHQRPWLAFAVGVRRLTSAVQRSWWQPRHKSQKATFRNDDISTSLKRASRRQQAVCTNQAGINRLAGAIVDLASVCGDRYRGRQQSVTPGHLLDAMMRAAEEEEEEFVAIWRLVSGSVCLSVCQFDSTDLPCRDMSELSALQ